MEVPRHVFTAFSRSHTRSIGLGFCLTALLLAGCSDNQSTTPTSPKTLRFAYVPNIFSNNVSAYTIDANTGALTAVVGSPFAAGTEPLAVTIDPTGKFAYVPNAGSDNVSAYQIDANTGALTAVAGSPFPAGSWPNRVTLVGF